MFGGLLQIAWWLFSGFFIFTILYEVVASFFPHRGGIQLGLLGKKRKEKRKRKRKKEKEKEKGKERRRGKGKGKEKKKRKGKEKGRIYIKKNLF